MGHEQILRRCGHVEQVWITRRSDDFGPLRYCPACFRIAQALGRGEPIDHIPLPALDPASGTPRQISYAVKVRAEHVTDLGDRHQDEILGPLIRAALTGLTDAIWWLDHKSDFPGAFAALVADTRGPIPGHVTSERTADRVMWDLAQQLQARHTELVPPPPPPQYEQYTTCPHGYAAKEHCPDGCDA